MIKNYLTANLRALWKNRNHTIVNLLGLALGITSAIILFLIVRFELSFDKYHSNAKKIYRVVTEYSGGEGLGYNHGITYPLVPAIRNDFPDPEHVIIVDSNISDPVFTINHENGKTDRYKEDRVTFTDPEYFQMFDYKFVAGNADALRREKTVVIAESIARKYFGNEPALNKTINFNNEFDVTVTGVVADPPLNSDLPFKIILSMRGNEKRAWDGWAATSTSINCYVQLRDGVTKEAFDNKLKGWHLKYYTGEDKEYGKAIRYFLQPLSEIHFDTRFNNFNARVVSIYSLLTLGMIGTLMLLTACVNFVNLNTVLIINRSKEAGIRKVMGSSRSQLVWQFLGETFLITVVALLISTGLVELSVIYLTPVLGYQIFFEPLTDPVTLTFIAMLPVIVTFFAGLYPALVLSNFQPIKALKNKISGTPSQGLSLRRILIVFQLVISQALVVCTIIVIQQLNHFMNQPLGINTSAVIEFELPENKPDIIHQLKERLQNISGVQHVTMSNTGSTSSNTWSGDFRAKVGNKIVTENSNVKYADEDFVKTYGISLLHGEGLHRSDTANRFLVNEKFATVLGFKDPQEAIGVEVDIWGAKSIITGIVNDFNTQSLHIGINPTLIMNGTSAYYIGAVRMNTNDTKNTIAQIQKTWQEIYPKYVFEYEFLDDTIRNFYDAERRSSYLIGIFAGVAILIGCIGLFGLVSFMAKARTKEVGIRKTLGASVAQVVALFSREFVLLILISFIISAPVAYYFMNEWLENFVYRIQPGITTFLVGIAVTFGVVLGTVGIKSYNAAVANPVDALRDE